MALEFGAHEVVDPTQEDPVEAVRELTDGEGADAVVVAVGNKEAEEQAVGMLRNNGVMSIFAGTYPATKIEVDPNDITTLRRSSRAHSRAAPSSSCGR
jgi:L-iditol 2-dehydrogenase